MSDCTPDSDAIKTLIDAGVDNAQAADRVIEVTVDDKGRTVSIPVMIGDGEHGPVAVSLLAIYAEAQALSRKLRLQDAPGPDARIGTAKHQSIASFIAHAQRFRADNSAVWADASARRFVSVLDYHHAGAESSACWGRHRGEYGCPLSPAWQTWGGGMPKAMTQDEFARFLDAHDGDLADGAGFPAPATLLSIAANLETFATCKAQRKRDPNTGRVTVSYSSDVGVSGDVAPPRAFAIRIPVFTDAEPVAIEVRLRVDVTKDGAATFTFQIHAADEILRNSFTSLCVRVADETSMPVFLGTPEQ